MKQTSFHHHKIGYKHQIKMWNILIILLSIMIGLGSIVVFASLTIDTNLSNAVQTIKRIVISTDGTDNPSTRLIDINSDSSGKVILHKNKLTTRDNIQSTGDTIRLDQILGTNSSGEMVFISKDILLSGGLFSQGLLQDGITGATPFRDGTDRITIDTNIFNTGYNVGIGTESPEYKLDVDGDIHTTSSYFINGDDYGQYFIDAQGVSGQIRKSDGDGRGYRGEGGVGEIGPMGPAGPVGATGAIGNTGSQGATGANGATGAIGPMGPAGATGATGATGSQGPVGATGATGTGFVDNLGNHIATQNINLSNYRISPDGTDIGIRFELGGVRLSSLSTPNRCVRINADGILEAFSGDCGGGGIGSGDNLGDHNASQNLRMNGRRITRTGTPGSGIMIDSNGNIGIKVNVPSEALDVQGYIRSRSLTGIGDRCLYADSQGKFLAIDCSALGITGATGATGATGPQGPIGATGAQGPVGPIGPQGATGSQGIQGIQGPMGPAGPVGATGATGTGFVDNLGNHIATQNINLSNYRISPDGTDIGIRFELGGVRLSSLSTPNRCVRINADGILEAFSGDCGGGGAGSGDNLGDHNASQNLRMNGRRITRTGTPGSGIMIDSNGNIGIKVNVPSEALDVQGYIRSRSLAGIGDRCLYADSQGKFLAIDCSALGITGATGPVGATGATGPQGPAGATGATGATGPQGPIGATGAQGIQGPVGPQGPAGATGATGPEGRQGPAGPAGATGAQGLQGIQGPVGPQGPVGSTGATGPEGRQGPAGPAGATGATGPQGFTGPRGNTGATGATGPQGIQGIQGPIGPQGPAGTGFVDNLGNHIATQNIRLGSNRLNYTGTTNAGLRLLSNNNVSISNMLEVSCGDKSANKGIKIGDDSRIYDDDCGGVGNETTLYVESNDAVGIKSNNFYGIFVATNGKVGIGGTTIPAYPLTVSGHGQFLNNLYISGNIGVGKTNPSERLDVNGTTKSLKIVAGDFAGTSVDGDIKTNNGRFANYIGKRKDESNLGTLKYGILINSLSSLPSVGLRVAMSDLNKIAANFKGRVGIGIDSPTTPLDVRGNIKLGQSSAACNASNQGEVRYDGYCFQGCTAEGRQYLNNCNAGSCGAQHNQNYFTLSSSADYKCSSGIYGGFTTHNTPNGTNNRTWTCTLNGKAASCSANKIINGVCSATHYNCNPGSSINQFCFQDTPTMSEYSWRCQGYNGGSIDICIESAWGQCDYP